MAVFQFEDKVPKIAESAYIAESAEIVGNVTIGERCYVGPNAIVRGDYSRTIIGNGTSIQEGVIIHARPGEECIIGNEVTVGHGAIIHGAKVKDYAVIGMGAIVSDFAEVGEWAVVAEGAVVKSKSVIPPESIAVGIPAKPVDKKIDDDFKKFWSQSKKEYQHLAERYKKSLKRIK